MSSHYIWVLWNRFRWVCQHSSDLVRGRSSSVTRCFGFLISEMRASHPKKISMDFCVQMFLGTPPMLITWDWSSFVSVDAWRDDRSFTRVISVRINEVREWSKGNWICLDSVDGLSRCTVLGIGLGLLAVGCTRLRGYVSRARPWMPGKPQQLGWGRGKKTTFSVNLWAAKISAYASVFSYWKHMKAIARKENSAL